MREIRLSILEDRFLPLYHEKRQILQADDVDHPVTTPRHQSSSVVRVGDYELHLQEDEPASIRHITQGHIIPTSVESPSGLDAALLARRLRLPDETKPEDVKPLIVWDLHLGAAATALAAILVYEKEAGQGPVRPMQLISFTEDLAPLRLALSQKRHFEYLRHGAADTLVHRGSWTSRFRAGLSWTLIQGASEEQLAQAPGPPDILFGEPLPWMKLHGSLASDAL
jgi:queuine tRNA-ribosyltransferase